MNALACAQCSAGLPPPDSMGRSWCVYCGTEYGSDRARALFDELPPLSERASPVRESWHDGEDAARIPMTDDAVLHLLRQHFDSIESVFVCPHIPPRKEQAARHVHSGHLSSRERILALCDASRLGTGDIGFLITSRRLCWRNMGETALSIEWRDFDPDLLYVGGGQLFVGNDGIHITDEALLDACANAFHVLALSGLPPSARTMPSGAVPRDTSPDATPVPFPSPLASGVTEESFVGRRPVFRTDPMIFDPRPALHAQPPSASHATSSYVAYASHVAVPPRTDFSCWHCKTPLHAKSPQCAFCGAKPKKKGWLRAG